MSIEKSWWRPGKPKQQQETTAEWLSRAEEKTKQHQEEQGGLETTAQWLARSEDRTEELKLGRGELETTPEWLARIEKRSEQETEETGT
jgi:hypothetical protein